ncbi:D-xylose transport system permease protein [Branchiibius hedensis]|uniref:Xylose transport system permease protein XylH n=1 Tax=Branchiibius hedensis TaxID=672460 RepID=A0A2Y9C270_9MICO|nr:ABC transporter permease [Branchiibius hedensis]PWJ26772.1 D-xylose transport system permease protein [Branchiibius hedensis]SSA35583.1 D-xylose transport system permease protein [Branchiibius hedensis]
MTTETPTTRDELALATVPTSDLKSFIGGYITRIRGGDMGSLPAVAALLVLVLIFSIFDSGFFSLSNLSSLTTQAAPGILLAMGLVFVLLLGEIDLSAGTTSGVGAGIIAVLLFHQWPWPIALLVALVVGALIGLFIGVMRAKLRVPSFVITLALFLGLQGVLILIMNTVGSSGALSYHQPVLDALENELMPVWLGWALAILVVLGYAAVVLNRLRGRRARNLATEPTAVTALKIGATAVVVLGATFLYNINQNSGAAPGVATVDGKLVQVAPPTLQGIPWVVPLILALVLVLAFVLNRTRYGRHIYAVGGNDEAARRAGIRVDAVRISVFVICSTMAVISGLVLGSQSGVSQQTGGGNTLLLAVGAAVVGGTSLFGGKGKITDAVVGGLVVAVIINGMSDLIQSKNNAAWQMIVTGAVLALAATVDALSRRRAGATGLG